MGPIGPHDWLVFMQSVRLVRVYSTTNLLVPVLPARMHYCSRNFLIPHRDGGTPGDSRANMPSEGLEPTTSSFKCRRLDHTAIQGPLSGPHPLDGPVYQVGEKLLSYQGPKVFGVVLFSSLFLDDFSYCCQNGQHFFVDC